MNSYSFARGYKKHLLKFIISSFIFSLMMQTNVRACSINPTANFTANPSGWVYESGQSVTFTSTSVASCGSLNYFEWWLDGVRVHHGAATTTWNKQFNLGSSNDPKHFMVKLRVRDTGNRWGEKTWKVDIREYTSYYVVSDHLGSPRVTVQDDGTTVAWQDYYPFGMTMPGRSYDASAPADQSGFTGYQFEEEGGLDLYHAEARNYDPVIGRFTSRDPLAQHFPSWTPYHYVHNNPISLTDPTGMSAECQKGSCVENKKPLRLVEFKAQNSRWIVPDENIVDHRPITYGAPPLAIPLIGKVIATTYAAIEAALITASAFLLAKMGYETLEQELLLKASHANWDSLWGAARPDENSEKNIRQQDGGYEQALKDFESLNPTGIEVIYDKKGEAIGKSGILPDGNGVTVRKRAVTDPRPTLERHVPRIRNHKKIRYNP